MDARGVNRALRARVWPLLRQRGFDVFTDRAAWRYTPQAIDVIEVQSVGPAADGVGCTSFSFGAKVSSYPSFAPMSPNARRPGPDGRPRPHYWDAILLCGLEKTLSQPWFAPFARPPATATAASVLKNREGLMQVIRHDTHDRLDTWYVLEDGSNLDEVIEDLLRAIVDTGLPTLDRFHDPTEVIAMFGTASPLLQCPRSEWGEALLAGAEATLQKR